jgi:hypothetical protein
LVSRDEIFYEQSEMAARNNAPSVQDGRIEGSDGDYAGNIALSDRINSSLRHDDERESRTGSRASEQTDEAAGERQRYITRRGSNATEYTFIQRPMGVLDVASVILNKMVGTGIFTVPGQVLVSTGSKKISLVLWAVGGIWTAAWYLSIRDTMNVQAGS